MVRKEVVKHMAHSAVEAMGETAPDCSVQELLSASFTVISSLIDSVLEHTDEGAREQNKASLAMTISSLYEKVKPSAQSIN